jgi:hypothetical protein
MLSGIGGEKVAIMDLVGREEWIYIGKLAGRIHQFIIIILINLIILNKLTFGSKRLSLRWGRH